MSGRHQVWVSLTAAAVAALSMMPLELQRQMINDAVGDSDIALLIAFGAVYLTAAQARVQHRMIAQRMR